MQEVPVDTTRAILKNLIAACEAKTGLLITKEGTTIAEVGDTSYLNTTAMAALIAGMFSATREVARMVGERQFSILPQQGESRHIHISLTTDTTMLVVIFEDIQRIGKVRHEARKVAEALADSLSSSRDSELVRNELSMTDFRQGAVRLINDIFRPD